MPGDWVDHPVGSVWYLPHHPVLNANKPGKVCIVFNCVAKHQGTSLNDQPLQGPDLTNNLVGILTCIPQEPVVLMANMESMFHQVRIRAGSVKDLVLDQLPIERASGVRWDVESDTFGFKISANNRPASRRGILSVVSSVYDPLGFAAPFTLPVKALLQDLCCKNFGWDEPISRGVLPIMAYRGRLRPKGVPFSGFRYIKGLGFQKSRYIKG